ncbi:hypothetical protein QFZ41_002582 [Luteibacter sp. W1I16]|uniref:hypothetical protein n=1 Tax=Luteibacter sp. W1I16 TaxID=3373922 RepID=UPI003D1E0C30
MSNVTATALSRIEHELDAHFKALKLEKQRVGAPVFALEHPYDEGWTRQLSKLLEEHLRERGFLSEDFWLCTVVSAAEHGYDFAGLEFWDSFVPSSSWWQYQGNRELLREWFKRFATKYRGAKPSGSWAERFRLISWPITHALLPKDLQLQLAETLHYGRGDLAAGAELQDEDLGRLIRAHAHFPTPRYRHFLQNEALVGQIVHTLLRDHGDQPSAIFAPTLQRISGDIASRAQEREWIRAAREKYAGPVARIGGRLARIWSCANDADQGEQRRGDDHDEIRAAPYRMLRTTFQLRRSLSGTVQVFLLPPSFVGLCAQRPEFKQALAERDIICNVTDRAKPATSLMSDCPSGWQLTAWPVTDAAHVVLSPTLPEALELYAGPMMSAPGPIWLFESFVGGRADQCNDLVVRPGGQYYLIARASSVVESFGAPLTLECANVAAVELTLPNIVPNELISALKSVGISVRRSLTVRAAGLFPRNAASGIGGEWLTTESVAFVLDRDHEIDSIDVTLDGQLSQMPVSTSERHLLIALGRLPEGRHDLVIQSIQHNPTSAHAGPHRTSVAFSFLVRRPTVWIPDRLADDGMIALVDPAAPTIDDFLTGKLSLQAQGAAGHVKVVATLLKDDGQPVLERELLSRPLPLSVTRWNQCLQDFLDECDDEEFLAARSGSLSIKTRDMGSQAIRLRADPKPIRWVVARLKQKGFARLVNDGVDSEDIAIDYYAFVTPARRVAVVASSAIEGLAVAEMSGLLVARGGGCEQSVVTSLSRISGGLNALALPPIDSELPINELIECCGRWARARPVNATARLRQSRVVHAFSISLLEILCGKPWIKSEDSIHKAADKQLWDAIEGAVEPHASNSYGISLSHAWCKGNIGVGDIRQWHAKTSMAYYGALVNEECIRVCWKAATRAEALSTYDSEVLNRVDAATRGVLVRGARLLNLYASFRRTGAP